MMMNNNGKWSQENRTEKQHKYQENQEFPKKSIKKKFKIKFIQIFVKEDTF